MERSMMLMFPSTAGWEDQSREGNCVNVYLDISAHSGFSQERKPCENEIEFFSFDL